jgi:ornithine cyclodeaminase
MRIFGGAEVERILTAEACVGLMRGTLSGFAAGDFSQPPRTIHRLAGGELFGFMPAMLGSRGYFGAKLVTAFHGNARLGLPTHMGYVMLFEAEGGSLVAMVDATSVTRIRTGAVSAVATDLLARKHASVLALIGAGAQAWSHLEAIRLVRDIGQVRVHDIDRARAEAFAAEAETRFRLPIAVFPSVEEAAAEADIVCTLTPSSEPILGLGSVKPGVHINAVGAFTPDKREIGGDLVAASALFADQVEAMQRECGEYLIPLREGIIGPSHIRGSIGDILLGRIQGRRSEEEITLFDALGLAVEDLACAVHVWESAAVSA